MIKKTITFAAVFLLSLFVSYDAYSIKYAYGLTDCFNIIFCNTNTYSLYNRTNWNIVNLLFFITVMYIGIFFVCEKAYTYSKGFRSMIVPRYLSVDKYLLQQQKQGLFQSLQYCAFVFCGVVIALIIISGGSIKLLSCLEQTSFMEVVLQSIVYFIKLLLIFNLIETWTVYLIIDRRYELIMLLFFIAISFMIFIDIIRGTDLITLTHNNIQWIYVAAYFVLYIFSLTYIKKQMPKKELW